MGTTSLVAMLRACGGLPKARSSSELLAATRALSLRLPVIIRASSAIAAEAYGRVSDDKEAPFELVGFFFRFKSDHSIRPTAPRSVQMLDEINGLKNSATIKIGASIIAMISAVLRADSSTPQCSALLNPKSFRIGVC